MGITLARRSCSDCSRTFGFAIWPWSGRVLVTSHGFCGDCSEIRIQSEAFSSAGSSTRPSACDLVEQRTKAQAFVSSVSFRRRSFRRLEEFPS